MSIEWLTSSPIRPIAVGDQRVPGINFEAAPNPSRLDLQVSALTNSSFHKPGFTAGLAYTFPSRGKWQFPVGLRYRRDALQIEHIGEHAVTNRVEDVTASPVLNSSAVAEDLLRVLKFTNYDELRTSGVEILAGISYSPGPRLHLEAGGGLEYLFTGKGPVISSDSSIFLGLSADNRFVDLNVGGAFNMDFALGSGNADVSVPARISHWAPRTYLGLSYDLTSHLRLKAESSWLMSNIYLDEVAGLRKVQAGLGLSWRIR
jgi:hypothetical protein